MGSLERDFGEIQGTVQSLSAGCLAKHQKLDGEVSELYSFHAQNRILIERLLTWARFIGVMLLLMAPVALAEGVNIVKDWFSTKVAHAEGSK
jgi:hypothetical protein